MGKGKASKAKSLKKDQFLEHWAGLEPDQAIAPSPVPYKHTGSTYAEDGIRITGRRAFVDSVISRLQDLQRYENAATRLQVVYKQTTDRETGAPIDAWNCYIQVHERGGEARAMNSIFGEVTYKKPPAVAR